VKVEIKLHHVGEAIILDVADDPPIRHTSTD
jgi:hypothetical protein